MELKELMEKLPSNCEVRIYSIAGDGIPLRTTPFGFIHDSDLALKYGYFTVKHFEYNIRNLCYDVVVERIVRNIDKLKEIFPYAECEEGVSNLYVHLNINGHTPFTREWLYAPYNEEEGKEEE